MTWYSAHFIMATRLREADQAFVPVEEMIFLIEAADIDAARAAATRIGKTEEAAGAEGLEWNGQPAEAKFLGIREIRSVFNEPPLDMTEDRPGHGTELTHCYFEVPDFETAERLARGEPVIVTYASTADYVVEDPFARASRLYDENQFEMAFREFLALAESDDASAMTRLAHMYSLGEGVRRDLDEAIRWELKAAELGDLTGMFNLAVSYRSKGDSRRAKIWFEKALQSGEGEAALELAKLYLVSDREKDRVMAYLTLALDSDDVIWASREEAERLLRELETS